MPLEQLHERKGTSVVRIGEVIVCCCAQELNVYVNVNVNVRQTSICKIETTSHLCAGEACQVRDLMCESIP